MAQPPDTIEDIITRARPLERRRTQPGNSSSRREVRKLAEVIRHPGLFLGAINIAVRIGERGPMSRVIGKLE